MFIPIALHKTPRPPENQIHPPVSAFHTANTTHRATARSRSSTIFTVPNLLPPSISPQSYIHVLSVYLKRNEPRAAHPKKAGNHPVCPINPSAPCSHLAPRNSTNQLTRFPVFQPSKWYTVSRAYSTPWAEGNTSHTHCGRARLTPYDRPSCFPTGVRYGTGVVWLSVRPHSAASDHHHHHCLSPILPARNTTRSTVSRRAEAILRRLVGLQGECILIGWSVFLLSDRFRWW